MTVVTNVLIKFGWAPMKIVGDIAIFSAIYSLLLKLFFFCLFVCLFVCFNF